MKLDKNTGKYVMDEEGYRKLKEWLQDSKNEKYIEGMNEKDMSVASRAIDACEKLDLKNDAADFEKSRNIALDKAHNETSNGEEPWEILDRFFRFEANTAWGWLVNKDDSLLKRFIDQGNIEGLQYYQQLFAKFETEKDMIKARILTELNNVHATDKDATAVTIYYCGKPMRVSLDGFRRALALSYQVRQPLEDYIRKALLRREITKNDKNRLSAFNKKAQKMNDSAVHTSNYTNQEYITGTSGFFTQESTTNNQVDGPPSPSLPDKNSYKYGSNSTSFHPGIGSFWR